MAAKPYEVVLVLAKIFPKSSNCLHAMYVFTCKLSSCRRGEDLVMCMDIQLVEALCGFQKPIATLDNRTIIITSQPGKWFSSMAVKLISTEH